MLCLETVSKSYRTSQHEVRALSGISLTVEAGKFQAIQGPSGCGKTTLLLIAGGLLAPDEGQVTLDGEDLYSLSADQRARFRGTNIGFVFQQFHLVPYLTVRDNVLAPTLAVPDSQAAARADGLLERFGLTDRATHLPGQLSSGERQRAALARALLNNPKLLLADEPTGNLDGGNTELVLEAMTEFARAGGAVLMVSHDDRVAESADAVTRLESGALAMAS